MHKFLLFFLAMFSAFCARADSTINTFTLLHRDTWSFSAQEIKALNESSNVVAQLASGITNMDGILREFSYTIEVNDHYKNWTNFRAIDLNNDGIVEIVVYISNGPRQPGGGLYILSRKSGMHYGDIISCGNGGIRFWAADNQILIIGAEPLFEGATVDPYYPFEMLYAWTGTNCVDVSRKNRAFYENQVIPELMNKLFLAYQNVTHGKMEEPLPAEVVQWALIADKLNEMFPELPGLRDLIKKTDDLLNAMRLDYEEKERPFLFKEFRNVQEKIRLAKKAGKN